MDRAEIENVDVEAWIGPEIEVVATKAADSRQENELETACYSIIDKCESLQNERQISSYPYDEDQASTVLHNAVRLVIKAALHLENDDVFEYVAGV